MEKYICFKRFKNKAICGNVNIPYATEGMALDGFILMQNKVICLEHSENSHNHFCRNDDGRGLERGKLILNIKKLLAYKKDGLYQKRWDRVWEDKMCQTKRQQEHEDFFLWGNDFYTSTIEELEHIYSLIREVKA